MLMQPGLRLEMQLLLLLLLIGNRLLVQAPARPGTDPWQHAAVWREVLRLAARALLPMLPVLGHALWVRLRGGLDCSPRVLAWLAMSLVHGATCIRRGTWWWIGLPGGKGWVAFLCGRALGGE